MAFVHPLSGVLVLARHCNSSMGCVMSWERAAAHRLSSVSDFHTSRGRGVGTSLMEHLLEGVGPADEVWLTTIG